MFPFYDLVTTRDVHAKARAAAERVVLLDEAAADAHYSLGLYEWFFGWDLEAAASEFRQATELAPSMPLAHVWLLLAYAVLRRDAASIAEPERAQMIAPISPTINAVAGVAHYNGGRFALAREAAQRALEIDLALALAHRVMGLVAVADSRHEDAVNAFASAVSQTRRGSMMLAYLGSAYARSGREADARKILEELEERAEH